MTHPICCKVRKLLEAALVRAEVLGGEGRQTGFFLEQYLQDCRGLMYQSSHAGLSLRQRVGVEGEMEVAVGLSGRWVASQATLET